MISSLAEELRRAVLINKPFSSHLLCSFPEQDRVIYLQALATMAYADQTLDPREELFIGRLLNLLAPKGWNLKHLFQFVQKPDFRLHTQFKELIATQEVVAMTFLLDLTFLAAVDQQIDPSEEGLIAAYVSLFPWSLDSANLWYSCTREIVSDASGLRNSCLAVLPSLVYQHLLEFMEEENISGIDDISEKSWNQQQWVTKLPNMLPSYHLPDLSKSTLPQEFSRTIVELERQGITLKSHPISQEPMEFKVNYIKALSLVSIADEKVTPEECGVLASIIQTLLHHSLIPAFIGYTDKPNLDEIVALQSQFKERNELQWALLIDALILAKSDGSIVEQERDLLVQFRTLFGTTIDINFVTILIKLFENIIRYGFLWPLVKGHLPDEIFLYLNQNQSYFNLCDYQPVSDDILTQLGIEFKLIDHISYGEILNGDKISTKAITVDQFVIFLELTYLTLKNYHIENACLYDSKSGNAIIDLSANGLVYQQGIVINKKIDKNNVTDAPLTNISPFAAKQFCSWLSIIAETAVEIPIIEGDSVGDCSRFCDAEYLLVKKQKVFYQIYQELDSDHWVSNDDFQLQLEENISQQSQIYIVKSGQGYQSQQKKEEISRFSSKLLGTFNIKTGKIEGGKR